MQVRDFLIQEIIAGGRVRAKLPSEHQLAQQFKVPRTQIRPVLQQLTEMGYLEAHQGVGYFIKQVIPPIHLILTGEQSFTEKMREEGVPYHAWQSQVNVVGNRYLFQRVRYIETTPIAIHTSTLPRFLFPRFLEEIGEETSLFAYLRSKGYHGFCSGETTIQTTIATQQEQTLLECGSLVPLILLKSSCIDAESGQVLEQSKILYRADIVQFKLI